jgi:ribosomal protein S18 acetylase RimI-like enzyme
VSIAVRRAREDDDRFILDLGTACAPSSVSPVRPVSDAVAARSFERLLTFCRERPGFLILVTDIPDDVTGEDQAFVAYMAVEERFRRLGVGTALIRAADAQARLLKLGHLSLMVTEVNRAARTLYARAGFREERIVMTKDAGLEGTT